MKFTIAKYVCMINDLTQPNYLGLDTRVSFGVIIFK